MKKMLKILKKVVTYPTSIFNSLYNKVILKLRQVDYAQDISINGRLFCVANEKGAIKIGSGVHIYSCLEQNPIGGSVKTILFAAPGAHILIGDGTGISNSAIIAHENIKIGKNVFIGGNCKIYDTDHHPIKYKERMSGNECTKKAPVEIKDGAFIGSHCIILKGVTIGERSVIGAGAVVTRNVPNDEIWAGNPAKFIKRIEQI